VVKERGITGRKSARKAALVGGYEWGRGEIGQGEESALGEGKGGGGGRSMGGKYRWGE